MMNKKLNETPATEEELKNKKLTGQSREETLHEQENDEELPERTLWVQMKIIPIWLRLVLVTLLLAMVVLIGLRFGYGYIGDGNPSDVLKKETWTHILDIIQGKE